ncbi:MAG: M6 family metalloprotease domain-containing protein, partial [Elusimicrobiota bacterium]|nr:M6 family metalloprotease domain-containing protein [Elusimicrobiota bacterium]
FTSFSMTLLVIFHFSFFILNCLYCVPAKPGLVNMTQPDGTSFQAQQFGDEYYARVETADGYTVMKNKAGWWCYASQDTAPSGQLYPTIDIAGNPPPAGIKKHLSMRKDLIAQNRMSKVASRKSAHLKKVAQLAMTGETSAVVILVGFTDQAGVTPATYYFQLLFSTPTGSMRNYYEEVSYNNFTVTGTVAGNQWYTANFGKAYYGADNGTDIDGAGDRRGLVEEAIDAANSGIDFAQYDKNNDGYVDHVIIVHSGAGQDSSGVTDDIWAHKWSLAAEKTVDGKKISDYIMLSEFSPMGTFAHEFFHDIGAPDLYDYDYDGVPVGDWCLMSGGSWLGTPSGSKPSHISGYLKYDIDADATNGVSGWLSRTDVTGEGTISINQLETNPLNSLYRIIIPGSREYFLLENRQQSGYDASLPEAGILIWHIDESMLDDNINWIWRMNDGPPNNPYYRAWVEVPGVVPDFAAYRWPWVIDDAAYSLNDSEITFSPFSIPNSNANSGVPSGVSITNISAESPVMTTYISGVSAASVFEKAKNFPNPFYPGSQRYTNIYLPLTYWGRDFEVRIYNMSGTIVRTLTNPGEIIPASGQAIWDGRNENGDKAASGLYYYVIDTGGKKFRGKITLIK